MKKIYNNLSIENLIKTNWFKQFNKYQQEQILEGLERKLDISIYAKPEFDNFQMRQIKLGLINNLNVSLYAKEEYSWKQMATIRTGLEADLDVSSLLDSDISSFFMNISINNLLKEKEKEKDEKNI